MRRAIIATLASASLGIAAPALAGVTLSDYNGPDLNTKIYAAHDGHPTEDTTVYGSTQVNVGHDVTFTGYSSYTVDNSGVGSGSLTNIDITDGSGFAQINDADFSNQDPSTQNLYALIMDPTPAFTDYEFSIQLAADGAVSVYYMLTGGTAWILSTNSPIDQNANQSNQYLLSSDPSASIDKILISSTAPIFEVKQNSINLAAGAVPEPGSWALMLLGFAGVGIAMRRSRKRRPVLMQLA
jgi:PEP-CTERM motif-containing protein